MNISNCELASQFIKQHRHNSNFPISSSKLAKICHEKFIEIYGKKCVTKPYFLYLWFQCKKSFISNPNMIDYSYFDSGPEDETVYKVSNKSYLSFKMEYSNIKDKLEDITIHEEHLLETSIMCKYPISLKSVIDNVDLLEGEWHFVLVEGNLATVKSKPRLLEPQSDDIVNIKKYEQNKLIMYMGTTVVKCSARKCDVTSVNEKTHNNTIELMCSIIPHNVVKQGIIKQVFSVPDRGINYEQALDWVNKSSLGTPNDRIKEIFIPKLIDDVNCQVVNKTLDSNKCYYDNRGREIYRVKGETILEFHFSSTLNSAYIINKLRLVLACFDLSIKDKSTDLFELEVDNISRLRMSNSLIFDAEYCRKAPPIVQPIVIRKDQAGYHLSMGKMVLIYEGVHYTTLNPTESGGHDYIGMISKFGDYDSTKSDVTYIPTIRTYKKNHLLSKNFKEIRLFLLRNSPNMNYGRISKSDILLPERLKYLYDIDIYNPNPIISEVHSKKITVNKSTKVVSTDVPDYIKSTLGAPSLKRYPVKGSTNGLLESCLTDKEKFKKYCLENYQKYLDCITLSSEIIEQDFLTGEIDHRIYGKMLEEYEGVSIIVFSIDFVLPYRYSKLEKNKYILLFLSGNKYDRISGLADQEQDKINSVLNNIEDIKSLCNKSEFENFSESINKDRRRVDYIRSSIGIVSYISNYFTREQKNYNINYIVIPLEMFPFMVEEVYSRVICYEGVVKSSGAEYSDAYVRTRENLSWVTMSIQMIVYNTGNFIKQIKPPYIGEKGEVYILSPVYMNRYNTWNLLLEDILYFSAKSYKVEIDEEVQCISIRRDVGYVRSIP